MLDVTKPSASAEPRWLDLLPTLDPPVRIQVRPAGKADQMAARAAAALSVNAGGDGFDAHVAFVHALAQRLIVDWSGVGDGEGQPVAPTRDVIERDEETGAAVAMTPGTVRNLLEAEGVDAYGAFERLIVMPLLADERAEANEKKG